VAKDEEGISQDAVWASLETPVRSSLRCDGEIYRGFMKDAWQDDLGLWAAA
jgi:hypothetical protein